MEFTHQFVVDGRPQDVIERFGDVPAMTGLLPGASVGERHEDGSYPATLVVSFGPKRIAFKGTVTNRVDAADLSGVLQGRASADIRGARMAVSMTYRLGDATAASGPATQVRLVSEAELSGVLGEFAKTGGSVIVEAMLSEFARRFSAEFGRKARPVEPVVAEAPADAASVDAPQAVPSTSPTDAAPPPSPAALSAGGLLVAVLRHAVRSIGRTLGRVLGMSKT